MKRRKSAAATESDNWCCGSTAGALILSRGALQGLGPRWKGSPETRGLAQGEAFPSWTRDQTYAYDAAGNRTSKATTVGGTTVTENAIVAAASNRVDSVQQGGGSVLRSLTYRTGGDLSQAVFSGGTTYGYTYNGRKRLKLVKLDGADRAQYAYDFRGLRVSRTVLGVTPTRYSHYVYDPAGHLLAEHDGATGAVVREFVWLDDTLLAVIESSTGTAATYFVHTGQIDEPLVMTDATNAKVWDAFVEPFGQAQVFNASPVDLGLRLPGQWDEPESGGLFQNWHRNYDPSLGRYVEADPLGIEAGQNLYAYVDGRPLDWIDPTGLDWVYSQSSGSIYHFNGSYQPGSTPRSELMRRGGGYAGHGEGVNNPAMQAVPNVGPIPEGCWRIGPIHDGRLGKPQMRLEPCPGTNARGRSAFLIHGDNSRRNRSASEGCIILPRALRQLIGYSGDRVLWVIP